MANLVGSVFTSGFEEFMIQDAVGKGSLLLLPSGNNYALQSERRAPVCYSRPEGLPITRNPAQNASLLRLISLVDVLAETTASSLVGEVEVFYG